MKKFIIIIALFCLSCANNNDKVDLLEFKAIELKANDVALKYEIKKIENQIDTLSKQIEFLKGVRYGKEYQKDFPEK